MKKASNQDTWLCVSSQGNDKRSMAHKCISDTVKLSNSAFHISKTIKTKFIYISAFYWYIRTLLHILKLKEIAY